MAIDELLRRHAWSEIYHEVCHQGVCYPDGYFLIPILAEMAAGFAPRDQDEVLILAGNIVIDLDEDSYPRYTDAIATLREMTPAWLAAPCERGMFLYRLQTMLAFEDDQVWGRELTRIDDGEIDIECPECTTMLIASFTEGDPAPPEDMPEVGRRLHALCVENGQDPTALGYLFGHVTCSECGHRMRVSDRVGSA